MPRTEPNSLPPVFSAWEEWRNTYGEYVQDFNASRKTVSDEVRLKIRLQRLGFVSYNLDAELEYIKEGGA